MHDPEVLRVDVGDTELGVVRWRGEPGSPVVFAAHGITANAWSWAAVARHVDGDFSLVAIDLRGRGTSAQAPGPFGMRRHGDDVAAVVERLGPTPAVLTGHSMGTYVMLACAERHPAVAADLVLVDGGMPLPVPEGIDPQQALDAIVGPAIERLQKIWPDRMSYRTTWSEHPAFDADLTPEIERYVLSDLAPCEGGFRSVVDEDAVRFDGGELITDPEMRALLDRRAQPVTIIRADAGLMGVPPPLIAEEWIDRYPQHDWQTIAGTNHYSVLIGEVGAAAVADALRLAVDARR
jgi:pimeloyl-ACP methyl ester carboxylesterase